MTTELQRENMLSTIAAYRLLRDFMLTGDSISFMGAQQIIEEFESKDYEFCLGLTNLVTILLGVVSELTDRDVQDVLTAVAETVVLE